MWNLFSAWEKPTKACKPCTAGNPTTDTVRIDAQLLKTKAEQAQQQPLTAGVTEIWATKFPEIPQQASASRSPQKLLEQVQPHPRQQELKDQLQHLSRPDSDLDIPDEGSVVSEMISRDEQGLPIAERALKGALGVGAVGEAVGAALDWLGLQELALEYVYEDLAAATGGFCAESQLGAGGAGAVYRGKLRGVTEVAVKVLVDMGGVEGFEDEVRVLSRFRHPHLVTLMGFCQRKGEKYLVYELMPGGDVEGMLKKSRAWLEQAQKTGQQPGQAPFPWQQRLQVALGAAKGLAHMVASNPKTFHRDIKPANILLDADGTPKMADFGLAAVVTEDRLAVEHIAGTPGYTCLSYIDSAHVTEESEMFSFGIVLLELMVNKPPALCSPHGDMIFPLLEAIQPYVPGAHQRLMQSLDKSGLWPKVVAEDFGDLALSCLDPVPKRRPSFANVVKSLQKLFALRSQSFAAGTAQAAQHDMATGSETTSTEGGTESGGGWMSWWK